MLVIMIDFMHDLAGGSFQSPAIYLFVACEYDDDDHERNVR